MVNDFDHQSEPGAGPRADQHNHPVLLHGLERSISTNIRHLDDLRFPISHAIPVQLRPDSDRDSVGPVPTQSLPTGRRRQWPELSGLLHLRLRNPPSFTSSAPLPFSLSSFSPFNPLSSLVRVTISLFPVRALTFLLFNPLSISLFTGLCMYAWLLQAPRNSILTEKKFRSCLIFSPVFSNAWFVSSRYFTRTSLYA